MRDGAMTEDSIRAMVDLFYQRVREDPVLGPVFEHHLAERWHLHMPRMYAFWTKILLGTAEFQGNVFGKHMALDGIGKEHFVHWLALFRQTAEETHGQAEAQEIMTVAERIATSLQLGYFGERVV